MKLLDAIRGKGFKARLLHPKDEWWDRRLGVRTFGYIPAVGNPSDSDWRGHYQATPYRDIFDTLRHARVGPGDVFVDLGCGLGRTVFVAHRLGAAKAVGVEIDPQLAAQCTANAQRGNYADSRVQFVCAPAQTYVQRDTTRLFMFHPFGAGVMKTVIEQLDQQIDLAPRELKIVYFNPVHDEVLQASRHLRRIDHWPERGVGGSSAHRYPASFWST